MIDTVAKCVCCEKEKLELHVMEDLGCVCDFVCEVKVCVAKHTPSGIFLSLCCIPFRSHCHINIITRARMYFD